MREENEERILHVWPRVRIGPESNPFTLAFPVRLPLDEEKPEKITQGSTLDVEEYGRLVERVYSSVATEIYKQIEIDLRDKMTLFPTLSLRALARYNEAEDFETSNTIDAYDRALDMYRVSLDELKASRWHAWMKTVGHCWPRLVSWEWTGIRAAMEAEAKTKLGYSRCLISRRLVSEMSGRYRDPVFEVRQKLEEARELLRQCYNSLISNRRRRIPPIQKSQNNVRQKLEEARELLRQCYNSLISNRRRRIPPIQKSQNNSDAEACAAKIALHLLQAWVAGDHGANTFTSLSVKSSARHSLFRHSPTLY